MELLSLKAPNITQCLNLVLMMVLGDLKKMSPEYLAGASMKGYGTTCFIGLGVPIPVLNEEIAKKCAISDEELMTSVVDYSTGRRDRPDIRPISYAELKSGKIEVNNMEIPVSSLSSLSKARKIAADLKSWIQKGDFYLYHPVRQLSTTMEVHPMRQTASVEFVKNMKRPAITIEAGADLKAVAQLVVKNNDDHIVVVDEEKHLEGFLTTFDIARAIMKDKDAVREIMIPKERVQTIRDSDPTDVAVQRMKQFKISPLPVVDENGIVTGIITADDLIRSREYPGRKNRKGGRDYGDFGFKI